MLKSIDWKAPEPTEYRASSTAAIGCWVQWEAVVQKDTGERDRWRWRLEMNSEVECIEIHGWTDDADSAKERVWDAIERFAYAFAVDKAEDWPLALSSLLEASETFIRKLKAKGHEIGSAEYNAAKTNFDDAARLTRRVLGSLPKLFGR